MQRPKDEASTALMPREALRDLIVASSPEDRVAPPPLALIATGIVVVLGLLVFAIVTRF